MKGLGKGQTASETFAITHQRQSLQTKVDRFQRQALGLMKKSPMTVSVERTHKPGHVNDLDQLGLAEVDNEDSWLAADVEEEIGEEEEPEVTPEKVVLYLPSNFTFQQRKEYGMQGLGDMEFELREGQANDSLERLRECLAEKSLRFRKEVRLAKGQKKTTRAWDSVHRVDNQIRQAVVIYRTARQAIGELGGAASLEKFQEISKSDLKMSGDVVEENRVGQKSSILPWFWRLDRKAKEHCGDYEKECKYRNSRGLSNQHSQNTVYRVNWLRARARAQRWSEERDIITKEMEWVIGTFKYMEGVWKVRAGKMGDEKPGHRAYAARETDRWNRWIGIAKTEFAKATEVEAFLL